MRTESGRLFWVSFADLMTALFIIALVLFVLSYKSFKLNEMNFFSREEALMEEKESLAAERAALEEDAYNRELSQKEKDELEAEFARQSKQLASMQNISLEYNKQGAELEEVKKELAVKQLVANSLIDKLNKDRKRLTVMEKEYKKLREIQEAIKRLDSRYFKYQPEYKRFVLRSQVQFDKGDSEIDRSYHDMLMVSGLAIQRLIYGFESDANIKYLLVIEGMASRDNYDKNYELSYARALSLVRLWKKQGIHFDNRIEVMISGSGEGGVGRNPYQEEKNQRFLIQIIPKIGELTALG